MIYFPVNPALRLTSALLLLSTFTTLAATDVHQHCKHHLKPQSIDTKHLSYTIDRSAQGLDDAQYIVDLSRWPQQITSWCEGSALHNLPFCGGSKDEAQSPPIKKVVSYDNDKLQVEQIIEQQDNKMLRHHRINYQPEHPRLKVKFKTTNANGALLAKVNIIDKAPIHLVSFESLLMYQLLQEPTFDYDDNLHWIEPKRSKRMRLSATDNARILTADHFNPSNGSKVTLFTITYAENGLPMLVQQMSKKWALKLNNKHTDKQR
jgi:hypothetical protein